MPFDLAAFGAFLSGAAACISAFASSRIARRRAEEECEKRMEAFREGIELGHHE